MRSRSNRSLLWAYPLAIAALLQFANHSSGAEPCQVPQNARYVQLPPDGGVTVYSDPAGRVVSFVTTRRANFALRSIKKSSEDFVMEAFIDGEPAWIFVPRAELWKYKFIDDSLSQAAVEYRVMLPSLESKTMAGTLPCAVRERREKARELLERGYEEFRTGSDVRAAELFWASLNLDSDNAMALYYWAYAAAQPAEHAVGPYDGFRQAIELGLPAELDRLAKKYVGILETSYPDLKDAYELRRKP